jgi:hypothetical protein
MSVAVLCANSQPSWSKQSRVRLCHSGARASANPESRDSGFDASHRPGMTVARLLRRFAPRHDGDGAAPPRAVIPRACGVSSTLQPLDSITDVSEYWVARRSLSSGGHSADPLAGDDDWECGAFVAMKHTFATSPRHAPEPLINRPPKEGVGNAGCPLHPRPRVHLVVVERTRVNEYTGIARRSRTQWF